MRNIFCASVARIFAALFGQDERGVRLVIAKSRIGRGRQLTGFGKPAAASAGNLRAEKL